MKTSKFYGMTLYKFMTEYAEKGIDYRVEDIEVFTLNTNTFIEDYEKSEALRTLDTWGRVVDVEENEEECVVYMQNLVCID